MSNAAFDGLTPKPRSAITVTSGGVLSISGSAANDKIRIKQVSASLLQVIATINGSATIENHSLSRVKQIKVFGNAGNDLIQNLTSIKSILKGGFGNDRIFGGKGIDQLYGEDGDDTLRGKDGNDLIKGGAGNDVLVGGNHDDRILGGNGDDTLYGEAGNDGLFGEFGRDVLKGGGGDDDMNGGGGDDRVIGASGNDIGRGGQGNDRVIGNVGVDRLFGGDQDDHVSGGGDGDIILGGTGNDRLFGQAGNDTIDGEDGDDVLSGSGGNDILKGSAGNDSLHGEQDNDTLEGGTGDDKKYGGEGNDTYIYTGSNLGVDMLLGKSDGVQTLDFSKRGGSVDINIGITSLQVVKAGHLSIKLAHDDLIDHVIGTDYSDTIIGNSLGNRLTGGKGDDRLEGKGGNDTLSGDADDDTYVYAGTRLGGDFITGSTSGEQTLDFSGRGGSNRVDIGKTGLQVVKSSILSLNLNSVFAIDHVIGSIYDDTIIGNSLGNTIRGGKGNDSIEGKKGDDILAGDEGDDTYVYSGSRLGSDTITGSTSGAQTLDFSQRGGSVSVDLGKTGVQVVKASHLSLNFESVFAIDHVIGSDYSDTIIGNSNANEISGRDGDDTIKGLAGNDTLMGGDDDDTIEGGTGDDNVYGDSGDDRYIYAGSSLGYDQILGSTTGKQMLDFSDRGGSVTVNLASTGKQTVKENHLSLRFGSVYAIDDVIGSKYDDLVWGNSLANVMYGGDGDDELQGKGGDDILFGQRGKDRLFGQDHNDSLYGGHDDDDVVGGSGNDGLFGGYGTDNMWGQSGSDRFLLRGGYSVKDYDSSVDAKINFETGDKSWTDSEIEDVDVGLKMLHGLTDNNKLLKDSVSGRPPLEFYRDSQGSSSTTRASNKRSNHNIHFYDALFNSSHPVMQTVIHEMGHNWDEQSENAYANSFYAQSGWVQNPSSTSGKTEASGGWYYTSSVNHFARSYGKTNPREDFATVFSSYVLRESGAIGQGNYDPSGDFVGYINSGGSRPAKASVIDNWIDSI